MAKTVLVVGGGLAGCECALYLAKHGITVFLFEQKPIQFSPAHVSGYLGELVCSNSFRSMRDEGPQSSGIGLLQAEMHELGSHVMAAAYAHSVPAGKALAVNREEFAKALTEKVEETPNIRLIRKSVRNLEEIEALKAEYGAEYVVLATGPLTSESLAQSLSAAVGSEYCYFYDAIAPIVSAESLNTDSIFRGSRYDNVAPPPYNDEVARSADLSKEWREKMQAEMLEFKQKQAAEKGGQQEMQEENNGDYLNCPMHKFEYEAFYQALLDAEKVPSRNFEKEVHFEGCMPIEALAERGEKTLTFGSLKPVGFTDPRTGRRPYALLQLRAENASADAFNLVGCQTKMTYKAQDSVFRLVPGLENAEFLRYGSVHRNTYVNAPKCLDGNLAIKGHEHILLAGQITGVEGYVESAACGLWAGIKLASRLLGKELEDLPLTTALGALMNHLKNAQMKQFQPSNIHFGLMPDLEEKTKKANRKTLMAERAKRDFAEWKRHFWDN